VEGGVGLGERHRPHAAGRGRREHLVGLAHVRPNPACDLSASLPVHAEMAWSSGEPNKPVSRSA